MAKSKLIRMDNMGIVVESLDETIAFFTELGLKLEGRTECTSLTEALKDPQQVRTLKTQIIQ